MLTAGLYHKLSPSCTLANIGPSYGLLATGKGPMSESSHVFISILKHTAASTEISFCMLEPRLLLVTLLS